MYKIFYFVLFFLFSSISNAGLFDDVLKEVDKELGGALEKLNEDLGNKNNNDTNKNNSESEIISEPKEFDNESKEKNSKEFSIKLNFSDHLCKDNENGTYTCTYETNKFVGVLENKIPIKGVYTWGDGSVYEGEFNSQGLNHGKGKVTLKDGSVYIGGFKDQKLHGQGKWNWANGNIDEGTYVNGELLISTKVGFEGWATDGFSTYVTDMSKKLNLMHQAYGEKVKALIRNLCLTYQTNNIDKCQVGSKYYENGHEKANAPEEVWKIYNETVINKLKDDSTKYENANPNTKLALEVLNYVAYGDKNKRNILALSDKKCIFFETILLSSYDLIYLENVITSSVDYDYERNRYTMQGDKNIVANGSFVNLNWGNNFFNELNFRHTFGKPDRYYNIYVSSSANPDRARKAIKLLFSKACKGTKASDF